MIWGDIGVVWGCCFLEWFWGGFGLLWSGWRCFWGVILGWLRCLGGDFGVLRGGWGCCFLGWLGGAFWGTLDTLGLLNFGVIWEDFRLVGRCWFFFRVVLGDFGAVGGCCAAEGTPLIRPPKSDPGARRAAIAPPRRQGALLARGRSRHADRKRSVASPLAPRRSRHADRKCSVVAQAQGGTPEKMAATSFEQMGLDARLLRVRGEGRGG